MRLFKEKIQVGENKWWIGFNDKGQPLFESKFYVKNRLIRTSRYPNTTSTFAPVEDGHWTFDTTGCTVFSTGTTNTVGLDDRLDTDIELYGGFDFSGTVDIPDTDDVTSATLDIYRHSFSKTKTLDTNYVVTYQVGSTAFASPMHCNDFSQSWTSDGTANWANTTGYISKSITTSLINKTGNTTFRLLPAWLIGVAEFKLATFRSVDYTGTTSDPVLTVVHAGVGGPKTLCLTGAGTA